jgi:hypothetical protein
MIMLAAHFGAQAFCPRVFLASLLGRFDADFFSVLLGLAGPPDGYVLGHGGL